MLKRLLIAVFVLGLVLALNGTAISDTGRQPDLNPVVKIDPTHERFANIADARPEVPQFKIPDSSMREIALDFSDVAPKPPSYFCEYDHYYDDTATSVWVYSMPDYWGLAVENYNTRFTVPANYLECTLKVAWFQMLEAYMTGDPGMRVYLWADDGFGLPGAKLDSVDLPNMVTGYSWAWWGADFSAANWVFSTGDEYHLGWNVISDSPDDTLWTAGDKGTNAMEIGNNRSSAYWGGFGTWAAMNDVLSGPTEFLFESERCCHTAAFSDCEWKYYYDNAAFYWMAPHPIYGDTAYAERFDIGGQDTLLYLDVYVFDPGDGSFGNDDIYVTMYDDAGGLPGPNVLQTFTAAAGTYPAYPAPTSFTFPANTVIEGTDVHIAFSSSGIVDYESCLSSDATDGTGRSSSIWSTDWHFMINGWGLDVQFLFDMYVCPDEYALCNWGPNCLTGIAYYWTLPGSAMDAFAQFRPVSGIECRVEEVEWYFYDYGNPAAYLDSSEVVLYANDAGLPGARLGAIVLQPADYNMYPAVTTVDFQPLGVYTSDNYWIGIASFAGGDPEGIAVLSDDGAGPCPNEAADLYLGAWETMSSWAGDYTWYTYSYHCCIPYPDRVCDPPSDWATAGGNFARTCASENAYDDSWCDLTLWWNYESPDYSVGLGSGPVIYDEYICCNFSNRYMKWDLRTDPPTLVWSWGAADTASMGTDVRCTPTVTTIDVGGVPREVLFVGGGGQQSMYCLDWVDASVIWARDIYTVGPAGLFGGNRFATTTVLDIGGTEVVYWGTEAGNLVAAEAATGNLFAGWTAANPVNLGGSTYRCGATDGIYLYYNTAPGGGDGDVFAIDPATGAIVWQLSATGGLQALNVYSGLGALGEIFTGGCAVADGEVYANSRLGAGDHPTDGVFYRIKASDGTLLSFDASQRNIYGGVAVDAARVIVPTLSRWVGGTRGGYVLAFSRTTGTLSWANSTTGGAAYYADGLLTCEGAVEDQISEKYFAFGDDGYMSCFDAWDGTELWRRRVCRSLNGEIGLAFADGAEGHLAVADFWGDLMVLTKQNDRPRMQFITYNPKAGINFGTQNPYFVDLGDVLTNTGCADLTFSNVIPIDAPSGTPIPGFGGKNYDSEDIMTRASKIADMLSQEHFIEKFFRPAGEFNDDLTVTRDESYRREVFNRAASAAPAFLNEVVHPAVTDVVAPGGVLNCELNVDQGLIGRGPNYCWIQLETNDNDFFLDNAGCLPEFRATIVGGCLQDTTYLPFGAGGANHQVIYNTGRIGYEHDSDENVYAFLIDGEDAQYYGGAYLYGVSPFRLACNTHDWAGATGPEAQFLSIQADPNWHNASCKPSLVGGYATAEYSATGAPGSYQMIIGNMAAKSFLDSVQNFSPSGDTTAGDWDWEWWEAPFDNDLTMGLFANTRTIGIEDATSFGVTVPLDNATLEILEFTERNGNSIDDWRFGELMDMDIGSGDTCGLDMNYSTAFSYSPGGGIWGAIKIPFGPGYTSIRAVKGLFGDNALWDWAAYWDSAYTYLNLFGHFSQNVSSGDYEAHYSFDAHDFTPYETHTVGIVHFGLPTTTVPAPGQLPDAVKDLATFCNKWAGFGRGDCNGDDSLNLADIIYLGNYVSFGGNGPIPFLHIGDVNDDGVVDMLDVEYLIHYYFQFPIAGRPWPAPVGDWVF